MIDGPSAPAAPTPAQPGKTTGSADLGKEEFLQLLVAQLKNQDPMNPSKPEQMAAQLAQFSSVEQLININEQLGAQAASNSAMAIALNNSAAVGVIGKDVLATGDTVDVTGAAGETVVAGVGGTGGTATLTLYDAAGVKVGSREVGPVGGGRQEIELGSLTDGLEPGSYRYELTVTDSFGESVDVQTLMRARIDGVRYGPQGPVFFSGTQEIPLANVVEIIA